MIYEPLAPARLLQDLRERGIRWIAIDAESYEAMGCNILAVRPGVVVMVDGVPAVRRALERAGAEVHVYDGSELSLKGDGGPTCLTAPLLRADEPDGTAASAAISSAARLRPGWPSSERRNVSTSSSAWPRPSLRPRS